MSSLAQGYEAHVRLVESAVGVQRTWPPSLHHKEDIVLAPDITKEDELHWLALCLVPGLGTVTAGKLIAQYHSPRAIFRASRSALESRGLAGSVAQTIASGCTFDDAVE